MIRILTDSSTGLTTEDVKKLNIEMMHMPISFDDGDFLDGVNITSDEFYDKLKTCKHMPKTSLIAQGIFEEIFSDVKNKGDEMIVLLISKELSGTFQAALNAKQAVGYGKIFIIDTLNTVNSLIALVMEAVKMRSNNISAERIFEEVEKLVPRVKLFAYIDTLKYLRAGGRLSGTAAVVGTVLNVKPIISIVGGKIVNMQKCIGSKKAQALVLSKLKELDFDKTMPVYFAHTSTLEECTKIKEHAKAHYKFIDGGISRISATVGTHIGHGAISLVFFTK